MNLPPLLRLAPCSVLTLGALFLALGAAGCSSPDATPDGGGIVEMMDAFVPMPDPDGGRMIECDGLAPACATLDLATCETIQGCAISNCGGTAVTCDSYRTAAECGAALGCAFDAGVCRGMATGCASLTDETECRGHMGCAWNATAACRGTSARCRDLSRAMCSAQPGCTAIEPDAGPLPPVDSGPRPDGGPPPPRDSGPALWDGGGECVAPEGPPPSPGCNPTTGIECDGDWRGINARTSREFCSPACTAAQCCTPEDGSFRCVDRDAAGACPASDLFIDATRITGDYRIENQTFAADSCEMIEGCIAAPGNRRLPRFDTWTPNIGTADMFLGVPSTTSPHFEWSACHGHYHFNTYAEYELLTEDGTCVAATGHKQAFCLLDFYPYPDPSGAGREAYTCGYQGIQRQWQDVYGSTLDCQWVDVTGVPAGAYQLRIRVNVEHVLNETNYANNEILVPVVID